MKFYFAPLEGLTDSVYRRTHHKYFPGIDRYYMPFLSPTQNHCLSVRDKRELPEKSSEAFDAVPQILTKSAEDFLWAANCCAEQGYREVNLNIGCPSGTVVSKGKGAGMLSSLSALESFLEAVFSNTPLAISVKTRIGIENAEEFPAILQVLNQYPITELTIHPRVRRAFYKGAVDLDAFAYGMRHSRAPVCYNGDICSCSDITVLQQRFPTLQSVMVGRGLIGNPALISGSIDRKQLLAFHEELLQEYCRVFQSPRNAMCRMKENWHFLIGLFDGSEKLGKQLNKSNRFEEYCSISHEILTQLPIRKELLPSWRETNVFIPK